MELDRFLFNRLQHRFPNCGPLGSANSSVNIEIIINIYTNVRIITMKNKFNFISQKYVYLVIRK